MEEMPLKKKAHNGRLDKDTVAKREKWVFHFFKTHPEATKEVLNAALVAQKDLGGMPMRPVRVYEIRKAVKSGSKDVPPVIAGKRPSRRKVPVATQPPVSDHAPHTVAQRIGRGLTQGQEQAAVQRATKVLQDAGFEDINISYRPPRRVVSVS